MDDLVLRFILIFLLVVGASAYITIVGGGALSFVAGDPPSKAWWDYGSENMLFAGVGAWDAPAVGGALTFDVYSSPSGANWDLGSALSCEYPA